MGLWHLRSSHCPCSPAEREGGAGLTSSSENVPLLHNSHAHPVPPPAPPSPPPSCCRPTLRAPNCVLGTVPGAGDATPSYCALIGQESARSQTPAALTNDGCPTLGPSVRLFLFPLCLPSSAHKAQDLISPHPNLPGASRPSSSATSSKQPPRSLRPPESLLRPPAAPSRAAPGALSTSSPSSQVLGIWPLNNSTSILRHPALCWARPLGRH